MCLEPYISLRRCFSVTLLLHIWALADCLSFRRNSQQHRSLNQNANTMHVTAILLLPLGLASATIPRPPASALSGFKAVPSSGTGSGTSPYGNDTSGSEPQYCKPEAVQANGQSGNFPHVQREAPMAPMSWPDYVRSMLGYARGKPQSPKDQHIVYVNKTVILDGKLRNYTDLTYEQQKQSTKTSSAKPFNFTDCQPGKRQPLVLKLGTTGDSALVVTSEYE